jgi:hypothetical protein
LDDWQFELKPVRAAAQQKAGRSDVGADMAGVAVGELLAALTDVRRGVARIEDRLAAIERALGISLPPPVPEPTATSALRAPGVRKLRSDDPFEMKLMARRMRAAVSDDATAMDSATSAESSPAGDSAGD